MRYIQSRSEQMRVVQACHVVVTSGHFGVTKTVARIKERFMWKGILRDVKSMVRFFLLLLIFNLLFDARNVYMGYNHYYAGYTDCCL